MSYPVVMMAGMGRPLRNDGPGGWYHVMNRGAARQDIFFAERDRVGFEHLLGLAHDRFGVRVHAYCLMTNHYHLLLECPDGGLANAMHLLGSSYVRGLNKRLGRDGPLFRDRYYAKPITSDAYLMRLVRYIHRNPLAIVEGSELHRYRWSSFRVYLGQRRVPAWMETATVLGMFDDIDDLDRYVTAPATPPGPGVGAAGWLSAIDLVMDEEFDDQARSRVRRTVAALLLDRVGGPDRLAVSEALAFPSRAAERQAKFRARRRAECHPDLLRIVDKVIDLAA